MRHVGIGLLATVFLGCYEAELETSTSFSDGSRTVTLYGASSARFAPRENGIGVEFGPFRLIVEPDRIVCEEKELARIPSEATNLELHFSDGKVTVVADGATIAKDAALTRAP
jgi:hypothetical protein